MKSSTFDRAAHCRRIASLGGKATARTHGTEHYQRIGRKGFEAACAVFGGDRGWTLEVLFGKGKIQPHRGLDWKTGTRGRERAG